MQIDNLHTQCDSFLPGKYHISKTTIIVTCLRVNATSIAMPLVSGDVQPAVVHAYPVAHAVAVVVPGLVRDGVQVDGQLVNVAKELATAGHHLEGVVVGRVVGPVCAAHQGRRHSSSDHITLSCCHIILQ